MHLAVTSGDLGARPYGNAGCDGFGDDGHLQYLEEKARADEAARQRVKITNELPK